MAETFHIKTRHFNVPKETKNKNRQNQRAICHPL